jgi:hypothetical protein
VSNAAIGTTGYEDCGCLFDGHDVEFALPVYEMELLLKGRSYKELDQSKMHGIMGSHVRGFGASLN